MEKWRYELYQNELFHHGIKGQKWGVRRGPPYPLREETKRIKVLTFNNPSDTIITTIKGTKDPSIRFKPNAIVDKIGKSGEIVSRSFYDSKGIKRIAIHTNDHGHPKQHPKGAHIHWYEWRDDGKLITRDAVKHGIPTIIKKLNGDIL
jgi:hypothetical protein